ncbi:hypothetical protein DCC62_08160 [candidate division KSB1 bacterium]|nr:MAG: hypothetical protein DCC62_08160 [candidate division KSB1 bacterium]
MKEMVKFLLKPENIPLTSALVITFGFLVFDIIQPHSDVLLKVILFVLGVIAFAMLAERWGYFERMERALSEIRHGKRNFFNIPTDWTPFEAYAKPAQEILISGGSLAQLVPRYHKFFMQKAAEGCRIRFILTNPASPALKAIASWKGTNPNRFKSEIELSIDYLQELNNSRYDIEARLSNAIPALTVMIFDASKPHGRIRVDLQLYQCSPERRPFFELTHHSIDEQEENLFRNFLDQFNKHWEDSIPLKELAETAEERIIQTVRVVGEIDSARHDLG